MTLGTATKKRTYVRAGGEEIAWQNGDMGGSVVFQAADAAGMSLRSAEPNGDIFDAQGSESSPAELDPLGNNVGQENPFVVMTGGSSCVGCGMLDETMPLWAAGGHPRATLNGFPIDADELSSLVDNGHALPVDVVANMHRPGFQITHVGFGIITYFIPGSINVDGPPGSDPSDSFATFDRYEIASFPLPQGNRQNAKRINVSEEKGCVFNINLKVPKEWLSTDKVEIEKDERFGSIESPGHLWRLKAELRRIFTDAGQTLVFNDPKSAKNTKNGTFTLSFVKKFSIVGRFGALFEPGMVGWRLGNKGEVSITRVGMSPLDLAEVGAHEAGHEFLENFPGNDKGGHSGGIMSPIFDPLELSRAGFTAEQAKFLSSLCKKEEKAK